MVGADGVRADHTHDFGRIGLRHGPTAAGDAGVVDEDVDVAERRQRLVDHGLVFGDVVDGRSVGRRLPAEALDLADGLPRRLIVPAVVDRHVGAVFRQREGDGLADAPSAAGDKRDASFERHAGGQ